MSLSTDDVTQILQLYARYNTAIDTGTIMLHFGFDLLEKIAGIAATAAGDWSAAESHFENALEQAETIPHKLDQCDVRFWYAKMLTTRGAPADRDKSRKLLGEAIDSYRRLGMPGHVEMAEKLLAKI